MNMTNDDFLRDVLSDDLFIRADDFEQMRVDMEAINNEQPPELSDGALVVHNENGLMGFVLHSEPERDLFHVQTSAGVVTCGFNQLLVVPTDGSEK